MTPARRSRRPVTSHEHGDRARADARHRRRGPLSRRGAAAGPVRSVRRAPGLPAVRRAITLVVGAEATLDLTLGVARLAETMTVVARRRSSRRQVAALVGDHRRAAPGTAGALARLPRAGAAAAGRGADQPAVHTLPRNGTTKFGAVPDQRYAYTTQIDGGDVDDAIWGNPTISLGQDAIAEFKVFRNQFDAQYGKATTAVVSVVTKSGTNRMSGSGYYFGRDKALNARNAYARAVPPFKQTRLGYSVRRADRQNRTHYFSAYEGLVRNTASITSLPATNPFAAMENGTYPKKVRRRNFDARRSRLNDAHNMYVRYAYDFYGDYAPVKPDRALDGGLLNARSSELQRLQPVAQHRRRGELDPLEHHGEHVPRARADPRLYATPMFTGQARDRGRRSGGASRAEPAEVSARARDDDRGAAGHRGEARPEHRRRVRPTATTASTRIRSKAASGRSRPMPRSTATTRQPIPFQFTIRNTGFYKHGGARWRRTSRTRTAWSRGGR